jgi:hypothetical protein
MPAKVSATEEGERLYQERYQRIQDAVALRESDRAPIVYNSGFWHARFSGHTVREVMYDDDLLAQSFRKTLLDLQPDCLHLNFADSALGPLLDGVDYRQLMWPGHGVADNLSYQYLDREVMQADEYGLFIADPTYFCLTRYLPRIAGLFAPLQKFPHLPKLQHLRLLGSLGVFAEPDVASMFAKLAAVGAESRRMLQAAAACYQEVTGLGFVVMNAGFSMAPFDYFADYLRGSKGIMLDMYRNKVKLLEAMERVIPILIESAVEAAQQGRGNFIFIPLHWGLDGFMSEQQFRTFYWPQLRRIMLGMIEKGVVPCPFWEGDCTSRLEIIADIPRGKAIYQFERTDLVRAKEVLGEVVCLRGNVPASLLHTGVPAEITAYCRQLIAQVGKNGGFILGAASGIPDDAPVENVRAMFSSVRS